MTLKISNLSQRTGDEWILRDVSLEVGAGEIFGLCGDGNREKSAVLQAIGEADANRVSFDGENLDKREIVVFPNKNESGFLQNLFASKMETHPAESIKFRNDFKNALAAVEKVLLLDNPFCCLDETLRDELIAELRTVAKAKNLAVILTAHDHEEIFAACDRVGILRNGLLAQTGNAREIYEKPNSVAACLALGRANLIKAMRVSFTNQNSQEFQTLDGEHRLQTDKSEKSLLGAINQPVTLAVRPEHISISFGASFPEDNLLKAKIVDVRYRGATTGIVLDANGLRLEALVLRLVGLKIGDECMVGLPPDRIRVLKD